MLNIVFVKTIAKFKPKTCLFRPVLGQPWDMVVLKIDRAQNRFHVRDSDRYSVHII